MGIYRKLLTLTLPATIIAEVLLFLLKAANTLRNLLVAFMVIMGLFVPLLAALVPFRIVLIATNIAKLLFRPAVAAGSVTDMGMLRTLVTGLVGN